MSELDGFPSSLIVDSPSTPCAIIFPVSFNALSSARRLEAFPSDSSHLETGILLLKISESSSALYPISIKLDTDTIAICILLGVLGSHMPSVVWIPVCLITGTTSSPELLFISKFFMIVSLMSDTSWSEKQWLIIQSSVILISSTNLSTSVLPYKSSLHPRTKFCSTEVSSDVFHRNARAT
ncbi:hypothetical protein EE612_025946 [Oryza sativa]|nr:hypothetical protein EE612_025946 [Oryza sativa]